MRKRYSIGIFRNHLIIKAVSVNATVFLLAMLFFETTPKSDDYDMSNVLCGGVNGQYSPFVLYIHPLLGYIMKGLMALCPQVAWYYIIQYVLLGVAFTSIAYILFEKLGDRQGIICFSILMIFCAYEFYVRITFSKTCGGLIGAGLFIIFYAISEKKRIKWYAFGFLLTFFGMLYRTAVLKLMLFMFFSAFLIYVIMMFKEEKNRVARITLKFVFIVVLLLVVASGLNGLKKYMFNQDVIWAEYLENNALRASVLDFSWPDYQQYRQEYEHIGVSENDYVYWKDYANIADPDVFDESKMNAILNLKGSQKNEGLLDTVKNASEELLPYLLSNPLFICYLCMSLLLLCSRKKHRKKIVLAISGFYLAAYYYMFCFGRIQHHIDVCVSFAGCLLLLYFSEKISQKEFKELRLQIGTIGLIILFSINYYYQDLTNSSYYGMWFGKIPSRKTLLKENYEKLELLSDDEENLYLLGAAETNNTYQCFSTFEPIKMGFYHNVFMLNQSFIPVFKDSLTTYGVSNPFAEIINNPDIYYCTSEKTDYQKKGMLTYIQEHYDENAYYTQVKEAEDLKIYRFNNENLQLDLSKLNSEIDNIIYDIDAVADTAGFLSIDGYAFMKGVDSFAQDIYVEIKERETGEKKYYYTLQKENVTLKNYEKREGKYSSFSVKIELGATENIEVSVIIENSAGLYKIPVEIESE